MAKHNATIRWFASPGEDFAKGQYSRAHSWNFDGWPMVAASARPHIVPMPWADRRRGRSGGGVRRQRWPAATCCSSSISRGGRG